MIRVVSPYYVAGIIVDGGRVIKAAPILRWSIGKSFSEIKAYFAHKGFIIEELNGVD